VTPSKNGLRRRVSAVREPEQGTFGFHSVLVDPIEPDFQE
jgi:hypothetical protein